MKILISASACNPYNGSEAGVGWEAVCRIAKMHDVFVLTHARGRHLWEQGYRENLIPPNVCVRYLGKDQQWHPNRLVARIQSWLMYRSFTKEVLNAALDWHREICFDLCHHVTIATWRIPSPLWKMPIPFIWGPIGGAGHIPHHFRSILSLQAKLFEYARDLSTALALRSSAFKDCLKKSTVIIAANEETQELLLPHRGSAPLYILPVLSLTDQAYESLERTHTTIDPSEPLRLFAGGNIEGRKGVSFAIRALAQVKAEGIDFRYTIAGGGPDIDYLKKLCIELGLSEEIEFLPSYRDQEYIAALHRSDIYLLPSFRETLGMTLVEAVLAGCYPIVADISAQGEIVKHTGGVAVKLSNTEDLISDLASAVIACHKRRESLFSELEKGRCLLREHLSSQRYDLEINRIYHQATHSAQ